MSSKLHKKIDLIHRDILSSNCKHLLRVIINDIDWNTGKGFKLGVNLCAEATSLSRRTIIRNLKTLKRLYLLTRTRQHYARRGISAMYTLNLEVLDALVIESKIIRMHRQTQGELDKEENLKKACGKPVNKPLLGDKMTPTLGDKMTPSSLQVLCTNTVGFNKSVDKPFLKRLGVANKLPTPQEATCMVKFLLDCKNSGIVLEKKYVINAHERYRGLVEDHLLDRLAA